MKRGFRCRAPERRRTFGLRQGYTVVQQTAVPRKAFLQDSQKRVTGAPPVR